MRTGRQPGSGDHRARRPALTVTVGFINRETGEIDAWAHEIINAFSSYAEVSPSGTGVKILALVDPSTRLIGGKRVIQTAAGTEHPKQVEVYVDGRFFTITGQILDWVPDELVDATGLPRRHTAIINASATSCEVMLSCIDQPTMRREYRSSTAAAYSQPSAVQMYVKSATHFWLGASAWN